MDPTKEKAEAAACAERYSFWIERISTLFLTAFWIHSCHSFFTHHSKNSLHLFNQLVAYIILPLFVGTNILWLLSGLLRAFGQNQEESPKQDPRACNKPTSVLGDWSTSRRHAFWVERSGMLLMCVSYLCGLRGILYFGICAAPCLIVFPVAHLCYLGLLVLGEGSSLPVYDKKGFGLKCCFGGLKSITSFGISKARSLTLFLLWPFHLLGSKPSPCLKETKQVGEGNDAEDTSILQDIGERETDSQLPDNLPDLVEEEKTMEEATWGGKVLGKPISEASTEMLDFHDDKRELQKVEEIVEEEKKEEKELDEVVSEESFEIVDNKDDEVKGKLEELELVEETKEKVKLMEKESDKALLEESFEMMDTRIDKPRGQNEELAEVEETKEEAKREEKELNKSVSEETLEMMAIKDDTQRRKIQELEKELAGLKEHGQMLGETSKETEEGYSGQCEMGEKLNINELVCKLSTATTQAEFYRLQAQENKENLRKSEEEKNELIIKLTAANASSELYRSLLHDVELFM